MTGRTRLINIDAGYLNSDWVKLANVEAAYRDVLISESLYTMDMPERTANLSEYVKASLAADLAESYSGYRRQYLRQLNVAMREYFETGSWVRGRSRFIRSVRDGLETSFWQGFSDGGAGERTRGAERWVASRAREELAYVDNLWSRVRDIRADDGEMPDLRMWQRTLDQVYEYGKAFSDPSRMLTFQRVRQTHEPCPSCKSYEGKRHQARWWVSHNAIPGPGADLDCKGYRCGHELVADDGNRFVQFSASNWVLYEAEERKDAPN
jgi:hypothetical protein